MATSAPSENLKGQKTKTEKKKKRVLLFAGSLPAPEIIGTGDSLNPMVRRNTEPPVMIKAEITARRFCKPGVKRKRVATKERQARTEKEELIGKR